MVKQLSRFTRDLKSESDSPTTASIHAWDACMSATVSIKPPMPLVMSQVSGSLGVVITEASKGLGYALARKHLAAGDRVVICARDSTRLNTACTALRREYPSSECYAITCDTSNGHGVLFCGT